ncbi:translation initiation factor IF-2 [Methanobrevibacter sp.]
MKIRSPIVSVLGHVDHGKTTLLDNIRGSTIASREAGGITQHIGATEIPISTISDICGPLVEKLSIVDTIPGLFFIDTPGHAAFTSLRKRGGALADLAILIVDISEGFKPQTFEALNILKMYKTPFIVAANKIDKLFGWDSVKNGSFSESFKNQAPNVQQDLEMKIYELVAALHDEGFQSERFDRVKDFASQIAIVPISASTGEGIIELITMLLGLAQKYLTTQLEIHEDAPAKGTVLEVKEEVGLGTTIDAIIYDGILKTNDEIALMVPGDVLTTNIRSILKPRPLEEIRESKNRFENIDSVTAAAGVKISAPNLDDVISGSPMQVVSENSNVKEEILKEMDDVTIDTEEEGVLVKADTLGSLEAVVNLLTDMEVPIRSANIGDVSKRDIINANIALDENEEHGVIFAFNVNIHSKVVDDLNDTNIKIFKGDVIYQLTEDYAAWIEERKEAKRKAYLDAIIKPGKIFSIPKLIFRQSKPAICGIEVLSGTIKPNYPLINANGHPVGKIVSMEDNGESLHFISRGQKVAMAIDGAIAGKDFDEGDELYVDIPENHYKVLNREFEDKLSEDEIRTLEEFLEIKRRNEPDWGKLGLFES